MSRSRLIARNLLTTLTTQILSWILTFAVMLYLPKYLGADGLGRFAFAGSLVGLLGTLVPLGTSNVLVLDIARDRSRTGELLLAAMMVRIPLSLVMMVLAYLIGRILGFPELTQTFILLMSIGMIVGSLNDALSSALQGQENLPRQSVGIIVEKFLSSILTIALVIYKAPFWSFAAVGLFTCTVSLVVNLTAFAPLLPTLHMPTKATIRYIVGAGIPFAGWVIFRTLYGQTDPIVLSIVTNDKTVGWYAAAFRLVGTTLVLPGALCSALMPTLARVHKERLEDFQQLARHMLALVILCGTPVSVLFICLSDRLIALMHYPPEFAGSIPVLRIGGIGVFLYYLAAVLGTTVLASSNQKMMFRASVVATLIGIPACFAGSYVTHHLWKNGAIGAISSDVMLETYLIWAYLRILPAKTFNVQSVSLIGRTLLASLPLLALLYLATQHGKWLWSIALCIPVYLLMCWALQCFDPQQLAVMRRLLTRQAKSYPNVAEKKVVTQ